MIFENPWLSEDTTTPLARFLVLLTLAFWSLLPFRDPRYLCLHFEKGLFTKFLKLQCFRWERAATNECDKHKRSGFCVHFFNVLYFTVLNDDCDAKVWHIGYDGVKLDYNGGGSCREYLKLSAQVLNIFGLDVFIYRDVAPWNRHSLIGSLALSSQRRAAAKCGNRKIGLVSHFKRLNSSVVRN